MQIQSISNSQQNKQNFNGKVFITPGDLSYLPAKYVRESYNALEKMIADKPFDLFIKQNHAKKAVSIIAQSEKDVLKKNSLKTEYLVAENANLYDAVAEKTIREHEEKLQKQPKTFTEKLQKFADNVWQKFLNVMEIEP